MGIPGTGPGSVIVPHASEVFYVFNDLESLDGEERDLAKAISTRWSAFATTGRPDIDTWPRYSQEDTLLSFQTVSEGGMAPKSHVRKDACDYWDQVSQHTAMHHNLLGQEGLIEFTTSALWI